MSNAEIMEMAKVETSRRLALFCKEMCPVCRRARRKGRGLAHWFVKNIDRPLCPMCKAYERVYGKRAYE